MKRQFQKPSRKCVDNGDDDASETEILKAIECCLLNDSYRIIYITGDLTSEVALEVHNATLDLIHSSKEDPIIYQINCNGGDLIRAVLPIVETIRMARDQVTVYTYVHGVAFSGGALLLTAGDVDCRIISPLSRIMIHDVQTFMGWMDHSVDLPKDMREFNKLSEMYLDTFIYELCKRPSLKGGYILPCKREIKETREMVEKNFKDGDTYLSAEEAHNLGFADCVDYLLPALVLDDKEDTMFEEDDDDGSE